MSATAIDASLAKWRSNAVAQEYKDIVVGVENCPLCDVHLANDCIGCPIMDFTGEPQCRETPLDVLEHALKLFLMGDKTRFRAVSKKMVEMLEEIKGNHNG